jgi:nitrite reductase/ring-hydroxylating ferredoxin subunit
VGRTSDFVEGKGRAVEAGDQTVAVFRVKNRLHALQDACPHMRASLADGKIVDNGRRVTCHMHGWTFDLVTGKPAGGRSNHARIYEIEVRGDEVWIRVPPREPPTPDEEDWVPWSDDFLRSKNRDQV